MSLINDQIGRRHPAYFAVSLALFALPLAVATFHDLHRSFITSPDADLLFPYHALRLNSGLNSDLTVHPGYTHFVLLAWWMKLTKLLGLNAIASFQDLPAATSEGFEAAYSQVVFNARYFVAWFSAMFAWCFFEGIRIITRHFWTATVAGLLFAASSGLAVHAVMIYTELQSAFFCFAATWSLLAAGRTWGHHTAIRLALCGFCIALALLAKVQAIAFILGLPVLALLFGRTVNDETGPRFNPEPPLQLVLLVCLCAGILALPMSAIVVASIAGREGSGAYQIATAIFVVLAMVAYAHLYYVSLRNWWIGAAALVIGLSLGLYCVFLYPNIKNLDALANFIDHLYGYGSVSRLAIDSGANTSWSVILLGVLNGLKFTLTERFLNPFASVNSLAILNWPLLIASVAALLRSHFRIGLQIGALLSLSVLIESAFHLYQYIYKVFIYADFPVLLGTALVLRWLLSEFPYRLTTIAATALVAMVIAFEVGKMTDGGLINIQPEHDACRIAKGYAMQPFVEGFSRYCGPGGD